MIKTNPRGSRIHNRKQRDFKLRHKMKKTLTTLVAPRRIVSYWTMNMIRNMAKVFGTLKYMVCIYLYSYLIITFACRHFTREALPRLDNYRNIMSIQAAYRPTLDELHNATLTGKVKFRFRNNFN